MESESDQQQANKPVAQPEPQGISNSKSISSTIWLIPGIVVILIGISMVAGIRFRKPSILEAQPIKLPPRSIPTTPLEAAESITGSTNSTDIQRPRPTSSASSHLTGSEKGECDSNDACPQGFHCEMRSNFLDPYNPELDVYGECVKSRVCTPEGESVGFEDIDCCMGLTRIDPMLLEVSTGCVQKVVGGWDVCIRCGDNVCGTQENYCNCPQDCERKYPGK